MKGVVATAKHLVGNEQEHFRQVGESANYGFNITESMSSNIDDRTIHELYLWPFADAVRANVGGTSPRSSLSAKLVVLISNSYDVQLPAAQQQLPLPKQQVA